MRAAPYLALGMTALAVSLYVAGRWIGSSGQLEPGDDTAFNLIVAVPILLACGVALAGLASLLGWGSRRLAIAALVANAGLLTLIVAIGIFAAASYSGT